MSGRLLLLFLVLSSLPVFALTQKVETVRKNAFFQENADNSLYEPLNLKHKRFTFSKADAEECGRRMVRKQATLHYTCTLALPSPFTVSKRQNQITPVVLPVSYAGQERRVFITVNEDASLVTYSTEFDMTGFDFEIVNFNDDFYRVYARTAVNVIGLAMDRTLQIDVLESHDKKLAQTP